jgi:Holliday junction resolvasome RuvABC endonuclease subunit
MDENERVFLAAAILLAPVGRFPADEAQIRNAVTNAFKLHAEVKRQHDEADVKLERSGVEKTIQKQAPGTK